MPRPKGKERTLLQCQVYDEHLEYIDEITFYHHGNRSAAVRAIIDHSRIRTNPKRSTPPPKTPIPTLPQIIPSALP
jgi:hypothetical protein